jgi:hypothetical protein
MAPRRASPFHQFALTLLAITALALAVVGTAWANPAARVTREVQQPDGSSLVLRLWGDEFANGWETLEGFVAMRVESSGWWTFAVRDASGALVPSDARVGLEASPSPLHLRPDGEALRSSIDQFGGTLEGGPRLEAAPPWASGATNVLVILVQFPADPADAQGPQPAVSASFSAA